MLKLKMNELKKGQAMESFVKEGEQTLTSFKVLIADDDVPTRLLLRAAISQWGSYDVIEASDGEEAWQAMQTTDAPRLLILDWMMPKIDGLTLCKRIKELSLHPYIILLTQVSGTTNIIKGLEAGANEFLSKPFNMAELRSRLSIGAKIIGYENKLSTEHAQLQIYIAQMEPLIDEALTNTNQLYAELHLKKIEELRNNLQKIYELIKKLKNT